MADLSDAMPQGGYFLPLFPRGFFGYASNALDFFGAADTQFDALRLYLIQLKAAHSIATATGSDLDDLGAWLGIPRLTGEDDDVYRVRIPVVAGAGNAAPTLPQLASLITASFGFPTAVNNDPLGENYTGGFGVSRPFQVTIYGNPAAVTGIPDLIKRVKAAGTTFTLKAYISDALSTGTTVNDFFLGDQMLGGDSYLLTIY